MKRIKNVLKKLHSAKTKLKSKLNYNLTRERRRYLKKRAIRSFYKSVKLVSATTPSIYIFSSLVIRINRERHLYGLPSLSSIIWRLLIFSGIEVSIICLIEAYIFETFYIFEKKNKIRFINRIFKNTINILALPITGPIYILDQRLFFYEILYFDEPLTIYPSGPFIFY